MATSCSVGTSESWIKGIPDPGASVLPNPASKGKEHLLSSSEAVRRGLPKRLLQEHKRKGRGPGDPFQPTDPW